VLPRNVRIFGKILNRQMSEKYSFKVFVDYTGSATNQSAKPVDVSGGGEFVLMIENLPETVSIDDVQKAFPTAASVKKTGGSIRLYFKSLKSFREALGQNNLKIGGINIEMKLSVRAKRPCIVLQKMKEEFLKPIELKLTEAVVTTTSVLEHTSLVGSEKSALKKKRKKKLKEFERRRGPAGGSGSIRRVEERHDPYTNVQEYKQTAVQMAPSTHQCSESTPMPLNLPSSKTTHMSLDRAGSRYSSDEEDDQNSDIKVICTETQFKNLKYDMDNETKDKELTEKDKDEEIEELMEEDKDEEIEEENEGSDEEKLESVEKELKDEDDGLVDAKIDNILVTAAAPNENYRNETILLEAWLMLDQHLKQHCKEMSARSYSDLKRGMLKSIKRGTWIDILVELEDKSCNVHPKRDRIEWNGKRVSTDHYLKVPRKFSGKEIKGRILFQPRDGRDHAVELRFRLPLRDGTRARRHHAVSLTAEELSYIHALLVNADFKMIGEHEWRLPKALEQFSPFKERQKFKDIRKHLSDLQTRALETHTTLEPYYHSAVNKAISTIRDEVLTHLNEREYKLLNEVERVGTKEFERIYHHVWKFISERDTLDSYRDIVSRLRQEVSQNMRRIKLSDHQPHCDVVKLILDAKNAKNDLFRVCSKAFSEMKSTQKSKLVKSATKNTFRICEKVAFMGLRDTIERCVPEVVYDEEKTSDGESNVITVFADISDSARVLGSSCSKSNRIFDVQLDRSGIHLQVPESFLFPHVPVLTAVPLDSSDTAADDDAVAAKQKLREVHAKKVRDIARTMVVFSTMDEIATFARLLIKQPGVRILRMKDRFCSNPSSSGWRDLMINVSIATHHEVGKDDHRHVCEIQIVHSRMLHARRGLPGHEVYGKVRNAIEMMELMPFFGK
jgi:hypothetical protein